MDSHHLLLAGLPAHRQKIRKRSARAARITSGDRCLADILGRFSDALLLIVTHRFLSSKELHGTGDEEVAIRYAIDALRNVYNDLDLASTVEAHR